MALPHPTKPLTANRCNSFDTTSAPFTRLAGLEI